MYGSLISLHRIHLILVSDMSSVPNFFSSVLLLTSFSEMLLYRVNNEELSKEEMIEKITKMIINGIEASICFDSLIDTSKFYSEKKLLNIF